METLAARLSDSGLSLLYSIMIEMSANKIGDVLQIILNSCEREQSVVFHCAQGKDRTGIIALLIELIVRGEDEETVENCIFNYCRTEQLLPKGEAMKDMLSQSQQARDRDDKDQSVLRKKGGLRGAPRAAIVGLLEDIYAQWGSVENYLDFAGFSLEKRQRMRDIYEKSTRLKNNNSIF